MATERKDPKQIVTRDQQSGVGSIFKTAIISAPIAIGGGMGISRLSKRSSHFGQPAVTIPNNTASNAIRDLTNRYVSKAHSGIFKDWQLDSLAGFSDNIAVSHEHLFSSWKRVSKIADPTGNLLNLSEKRLGVANSGRQFLQDLMTMFKGSDSAAMSKAAGMFIEDLSVLNPRAIAKMPIHTTSLGNVLTKSMSSGIKISSIDPMVAKDLQQVAGSLGMGMKISRSSRPGIEGSELLVSFFHESGESVFSLKIPEVLQSNPNLVVSGKFQQTKRIAGRYGIVEQGILKQSFNHEQWYARRAFEELLPQLQKEERLTRKVARQAVGEFESRMMESLEWVPSVPEGMHTGIDKFIAARSNMMRLYTPESLGGSDLRFINEFEYSDIMQAGGAKLPDGGILPLFPGASSSQIAHGVVSTKDWRGMQSLVPEAAGYGRRPLQALRMQYTPTPAALASMGANPFNQRFAWAANQGLVDTPMIKSMFVSSKLDPQLSKYGISSEGQHLISSALSEQRAMSEIVHFEISSNHLRDLAGHLGEEGINEGMEAGKWGLNKTLSKGTFLGYSPEGSPVVLPQDITALEAIRFQGDKGKGDFIRLSALQDVENTRGSKTFGYKGMAIQQSPNQISSIAREVAESLRLESLTGRLGELNEVQAIITMDELRKNRNLHYNQMFTSLWEFSKTNMQNGKNRSKIASNFANDPVKYIASLREAATQGEKFSHDVMLQGMFRIARKSKLTPAQMGGVFGAVPEVFGEGWENIMKAPKYQKLNYLEIGEINKGVALGVSQMYFGGVGAPGAGGKGSIEPRLLELLDNPGLGNAGPAIKEEIIHRMLASNPHRSLEHNELTKALQSTFDLKTDLSGVSAGDLLGGIGSGEYVPSSSSWMNLKNIGNVYIPGSNDLSQLRPYQTPAGGMLQTELSKSYRGFFENADKYEKGLISKEAMQGHLASLQSQLTTARMETISGTNSLTRGKLPGSQYLTATFATQGQEVATNQAGITKSAFRSAMSDLEQLGMHSPTDLAEMRSQFEAGGIVPGVVIRHPVTGPYSAQPIGLKMIEGNETDAVFNQSFFKTSIKHSNGALEELSNPIRLSPLIGMSGDVDGDAVSVMLAGPQLGKTLTTHMNDPEMANMYEQHAIRMQLLKSKAKDQRSIYNMREAMAGDSLKLGVTQSKRLGRISNELQVGKAAIRSGLGNLSPQERMNSMALLEWMENVPIAAKHIKSGEERGMIVMMDDIHDALKSRNAGAISSLTKDVLSDTSIAGKMALDQGMDLSLQDMATGGLRNIHLPGINIERTAEHVANTMQAFDNLKIGGMSARRSRDVFMGKGRAASAAEAQALLSHVGGGVSPLADLVKSGVGPPRGVAAEASEMVMSKLNRLGAAGKSMLPNVKPLLLGTGIALGLATILSSPPGSLGPEQKALASPDMKSGTGGAYLGLNLHPDPGPSAEPTAANLVSAGNTARISGTSSLSYGNNVKIRMNSDSRTNYSNLNRQLGGSLGGRTQIRTSLSDRRSSLTAQKLNDILSNS